MSEEKTKSLRKWWQFPFKIINTNRGGADMPKRQPCPRCHSQAKRIVKLIGGANYNCSKHGEFFVKR